MNNFYKSVPALILLLFLSSFAKIPNKPDALNEVNETITVLNTQITITPQGKARIEEKMKSLTQNQTYYNEFLNRCLEYFPVIERELNQIGAPEDLKFLSLQESTLKGEAVSRSNAVGFWQFKEPTALEYQLRVDNTVDERKNVISSSRAAGQYLKKSNYYLQNWVYAVLSYNLGLTGAKNYIKKNNLTNQVIIDKNTHQYIVHYLAHYYAFQKNYEQKKLAGQNNYLLEYAGAIGNDFNEIAQFVLGEEAKANPNYKQTLTSYTSSLKQYNPWLLSQRVPKNNSYCFSVIVPVSQVQRQAMINKLKPYSCEGKVRGHDSRNFYVDSLKTAYPFILERNDLETTEDFELIYANGVRAVKMKTSMSVKEIIPELKISSEEFFKYNDKEKMKKLKEGEVYYIAEKPEQIPLSYHLIEKGDDLYDISQKYGIQLARLYEWNDIDDSYKPNIGDKIKFNPSE